MPTRKVFEGKSGAELELTRSAYGRRARDWDAGSTSEQASETELLRPFGLELLIANALSERLDLEIGSRGVLHRQTHARGLPQGPLAVAGKHEGEDRQRIRFWPDVTILGSAGVDLARLHERLSDLALLYPRMSFDLQVEQRTYSAPRGLQDGVERIWPMMSSIGPVLAGSETFGGVQVELAMRWVESGGEIRSFINHKETSRGGSHVDGLLQAIKGAIRQEHERAGKPLPRHKKVDATAGLIALVRVQMEDPSWEDSAATKLSSGEARLAVRLLAERMIGPAVAASPELREHLAR